MTMKTQEEKFYDRINKTDNCWLWIGKFYADGYPRLGQHRAHRLSHTLFIGEIPEGYQVRHKCDIPACVNPEHLIAGTAQDNADDRDGRKRNHHSNKIQCPYGHLYEEEGGIEKHRRCKECDKKWSAKYAKTPAGKASKKRYMDKYIQDNKDKKAAYDKKRREEKKKQ